MKDQIRLALQILIALAILALAARTRRQLAESPPEIAKREVEKILPTVTVALAQRVDIPTQVSAEGSLAPAREVTLRPEVSGKLVWVHPDLIPGATFEEGTELYRIEDRDYRYEVDRARSLLYQARKELEIEEGRHRVAQREWEIFQKGKKEKAEPNPLALRLPQLASAKAKIDQALVQLRKSELNLERCSIQAPFAVLVESKMGELGEIVQPQTDLVHLVGTEKAWIELSLSPRQVDTLGLAQDPTRAIAGQIEVPLGEKILTRTCRSIHLLGRLDDRVRFAKLLLEVDDPMGLHQDGGRSPVLFGAYATSTLPGRTLEGVIPIPRSALREGSRVYLADEANRLVIREVRLAYEDPERFYVRSGIEPGERVLITHLGSPVPGTELEVQVESLESAREGMLP